MNDTGNATSAALREELESWLANREDVLQFKERARLAGSHFNLIPAVYDPEELNEPLRTMAMRALGYSDEQIARADEPQAPRPFEDFALKFVKAPSEG